MGSEMCIRDRILGLSKGYTISQFKVRENSWLAGRKLRELKLDEEGVLILSVYRKIDGEEKFIGAPSGDTEILVGDILICYGPEEAVRNLSIRLKGAKGDMEHVEAVKKEQLRKHMRKMSGGYD